MPLTSVIKMMVMTTTKLVGEVVTAVGVMVVTMTTTTMTTMEMMLRMVMLMKLQNKAKKIMTMLKANYSLQDAIHL